MLLSITRTTGLLAVALSLLSGVSATTINGNTAADLCSSLNTDGSESGNYSMYQTQGLCSNFCREKDAAYAIVQYQYCWCSNIAPGSDTIVNDDKCNTQCPGYTEWCGSKSSHLFGYVELGPVASSTMAGSSSSTSTSSTSSTSTSTSTSSTSTTTTAITTSSSSTSTTEVGNTSSSPSTATPQSETSQALVTSIVILTSTPPKTTSVQTTTNAAGAVATVTTIATAVPSTQKKSSSNTALIVGVTVGISAVIVLAIAGLFWYKWRKRSEQMEVESKVGFRDSGGTTGTDGGFSTPSRRDSRFMPTDPRMDPFTPVYSRKSHESIGTLRDEQDYSRRVHQPRVLRAVNPDPLEE